MKKNKNFKLIKIFLLLFCSLAFMPQEVFALKKREPVEIEIKSHDEFKLKGILDIPDYASVETKAPLVIFLHSIGKSHLAWGDYPKKIKGNLNVATLSLDLRGHGKSVKNKKNKNVFWQNLVVADYQKMPDDILEVLKFIEKEYPEINHKKIAVIGASLGSNVGIMAAGYNEKINNVIMFSPMLQYKGFDLRLPIVKYGQKPLLMLVSNKDKYSYDSSIELIKFPQGKKHLQVYPYGGHGEDLLKFQPESQNLVLKWLRENFTDGKIIIPEEKLNKEKSKYQKIEEYSGKIKKDRNIYRGVHER
ncbi:MAG TPA: alpha/beta hydrolase [Candidatus Gastranaerophilales bacterium]|nr:alpha/beta hydrolase [Candidatus Gastranaerophilales bacterium]